MSLDFYLEERISLFDRNITHNLGNMAEKVGVYEALWRPDEYGFKYASDIVPILKHGINKMKKEPDKYKQLNPENGWGDYEGLLSFCEEVLANCEKFPRAEIRISR